MSDSGAMLHHLSFDCFAVFPRESEYGDIMREQRPSTEQRSSIAVAAFYTTSALVATLGMAILLTSATIAYTIAQSIH